MRTRRTATRPDPGAASGGVYQMDLDGCQRGQRWHLDRNRRGLLQGGRAERRARAHRQLVTSRAGTDRQRGAVQQPGRQPTGAGLAPGRGRRGASGSDESPGVLGHGRPGDRDRDRPEGQATGHHSRGLVHPHGCASGAPAVEARAGQGRGADPVERAAVHSGITCSGTPGSALRPVTAPRAARLLPGISCRAGWMRSHRPPASPSRYRWTCSASLPACPPRRRRFLGMALKSGLSSIKHMPRAMRRC